MEYLFRILKNIFYILNYFFSIIYSGYIKNNLGNCGIDFATKFPLQVIGGKQITIGNNFSSFRRNRIEVFGKILNKEYAGKLVIGNNFSMNDDCHISLY